MAPRTRVEEEFTDLSGQPDGTPDDQAGELERGLAGLSRGDDAEIKDEDLEVLTEEEEEEGQSGGADEGDEEEGDEDGADDGAASGESDFDPKDVQILLKDAELLDEKEKAAKNSQERAEADIKAAKAAMKTAKEAGDTDADIDATEAFSKATVALENAKATVAHVAGQKTALQGRAKELFAKAPKDAEGNAIVDGTKPARRAAAAETKESKLVPKFKTANKWFGNANYKKQQQRLIELDRGLAAEGRLNKNDPKYFTELGNRFNREFPGLYRDLDGKPIATGERRRSAGAPIPGSGNSGRGAGGGADGGRSAEKVGLVQADLKLMQQFGMDPDNKEHRRTFLSEKRQLAGAGRA